MAMVWPAVMSAPKATEPITQGGESVFSYRMDHSVAPYMIAIGVGDLAFKSLGPRTGVWTEPVMLDRAAKESHYDSRAAIDRRIERIASRSFSPRGRPFSRS